MDSDILIYQGDAVKALGDGKVGGYLVRFTKAGDYDLSFDRFDPRTDFGDSDKLPVIYNHGMDAKLGRKRIGKSTLRPDDVGLWIEAQLQQRDEYERAIYDLAQQGKLSWSSGAASHTVERENEGKGAVITQWYLSEASLTPTPAEPRNVAVSIKSLEIETLQADAQAAQKEGNASEAQENKPEAAIEIVAASASSESAADKSQIAEQSAKGKNEMDEIKTVLEAVNALAQQITAQGEELKAVKTALEQEPPINGGNGAKAIVSKDPADTPFPNIAENCKAVKDYTLSMGAVEAPRIKYLKATGASEGVPTDGGILLDPTLSAEFIAPIHQTGVFSSKVRRLPVGGNSNYGWINGVDETSRVAGSRWGGVRGYRVAEAASPTASKPTFRRIQWELKKYGVLVYGTDELLADAAQWSAVVNQAAREELAFMVNDDIMNGLGVAGAQGFMNSGALITVTRNTGSAVLHADILAMWNRLSPESKATAEWYIHNEVQPQLDALYFTGSTSVMSPYVGYRPDGVMTLYGRPVNVTEFNAALNTTGDIVLADLNQYLFWEKGGVQEATSIHVQFTADEQVFRFIYRSDGKSAYASALTPYKGSTTTSPFVVLGSAT